MSTTKKINANGTEISVLLQGNENDYICLADMARYKDKQRTDYIIQNWLRSRSTIEYLGVWEQLHNPNFNPIEFDGFRNQAGLHSFSLTPKEWVQKTNAIGLYSKAGRYGGTYAHKDIAFNFGMWLSPTFQLYVVKEYQQLKEEQANPELAKKLNMRDTASINELVVLSNMESLNSELIKQEVPRDVRYEVLHRMAEEQLKVLNDQNAEYRFKKLTSSTEISE